MGRMKREKERSKVCLRKEGLERAGSRVKETTIKEYNASPKLALASCLAGISSRESEQGEEFEVDNKTEAGGQRAGETGKGQNAQKSKSQANSKVTSVLNPPIISSHIHHPIAC